MNIVRIIKMLFNSMDIKVLSLLPLFFLLLLLHISLSSAPTTSFVATTLLKGNLCTVFWVRLACYAALCVVYSYLGASFLVFCSRPALCSLYYILYCTYSVSELCLCPSPCFLCLFLCSVGAASSVSWNLFVSCVLFAAVFCWTLFTVSCTCRVICSFNYVCVLY
jgi:hypothetical protein